jgi:hypothetical protein
MKAVASREMRGWLSIRKQNVPAISGRLFAAGWINSSKRNATGILDPFEVEDDWFEIILPSLQLIMTDRIPPEFRKRAEDTIERLHLRDDERVIRQRRSWMKMYEQGKLRLDVLREFAPLIARAIEKHRL